MSGRVALWLPVVVSFVVQVPAAVFAWRARFVLDFVDESPGRFAARLALALVGPVALLFARRFPGPVVAVVTAAAAGYVLIVSGDGAPPYIALAFAIVSAVVRDARRWALISLGAGWILTVTFGVILGVSWQPALVVAVSLALVLMLALGETLRTRRRRFDELRRQRAERRAAEAQAERVRIARELHDVLAHSLSQISVQAGVGLHLIDTKPEEAAKALADIKATSRSALDEVRSVLGVLRGEADETDETGAAIGPGPAPLVPTPDLSRLGSLAESVRSQGLEVDVHNRIVGASGAVQLALYRIVQESLTNVLRHSGSARAQVVLVEDATGYRATITDEGASRPSGKASAEDPAGSGRGLLGMRERAELLGGRLEAGPVEGGGFRVVAVIPKREAAGGGTSGTPLVPGAGAPTAEPRGAS
jgi:signal transduction histidine kinase